MMFGVYLQVSFALIFFRSESMHAAFALIADMFGRNSPGTLDELLAGGIAFALFPVVWFFPNTQQILGQETSPGGIATSPGTPNVNPTPVPSLFPNLHWRPNLRWAVLMAMLFFAVLANLDSTTSFLYFQF
jgi:hypothetical protein